MVHFAPRWNPATGVRLVGKLGRRMSQASPTPPRLLVVEDEYLIRMLLEDMLDDLGYRVAAAVGTLAEAREAAANGDFNAAILDVNVDGEQIFPVAEILAGRGLRSEERRVGKECRARGAPCE